MFAGVHEKLERAGYFLNNLKVLAEEAGGFSSIYIKKIQETKANLDGFFFEIVSAKDFFLQGVNHQYGLGLQKQEATDIAQLKRCLECKGKSEASEIVTLLEKQLHNKDKWLWRLTNYRNSATHRELLHFGHKVSTEDDRTRTSLFKDPEDPQQGNADMEVIPYCEQSLDNMREFLDSLYSQLGI